MIHGVRIEDLATIPDERGMVKHFITDEKIGHFGECYITQIYDGIIKGWHGYNSKTIYYCVPQGAVKLVLWDSRESSGTYNDVMEIFLGEVNYKLVVIPPGVFNAFRGIAKPISTIVVAATEVFNEERTLRLPYDDPKIPYDWEIRYR